MSDPTTPSGGRSPFAALAHLFGPDPYQGYQRWRERTPVARLGPRHVVVAGYVEATRVLCDNAFGHPEPRPASDNDHDRDRPVDGAGRVLRAFISLNPPDHTRLRRLVSKAFTSRTLERLAPRVAELTNEMIGAALDAGQINLIDAVATPLPIAVISDMLGIPHPDRARFAEWSHTMARATDLDFLLPQGVRESAARARQEFSRYVGGLAAERRRNPTNDLLSELARVSDASDMLNDDELAITIMMLLIAGHETTTNLIGNGVLALLSQPDQLRALADDPGLAEGAVEEFLRYDSPVQLTLRTALHDTTVGEVAIAAGTSVLVLLGAANRDPAANPRPETLDITRTPNRHLAFGQGIHFCLGAPLARLQGRIVLRELARRAPTMKLAGEPRWKPTSTLRGLADLPTAFR